jgi:hypothetical protein
MKIEKILSWSEYRILLFERIQSIIESSNCSNYTILGYKFLDTKLILHYHDCNRVFMFEFFQIGEGYVNEDISKQFLETSFYTKDFTYEERMEQPRLFENHYNKDTPEIIGE